MQYLSIFHNGFTDAPQCSVIGALPVLLYVGVKHGYRIKETFFQDVRRMISGAKTDKQQALPMKTKDF
jgi:hypothetical protein